MTTIKNLFKAICHYYSFEYWQKQQDLTVIMDNIRDYYDLDTAEFFQLRSEDK